MTRSTLFAAGALLTMLSVVVPPADAAKKDTKAKAQTSLAALAEVEKAAGKKIVPGSRIRFETSKGTFVAVMFPKETPKTVANFEKLVKKGFYNGLTFHRVIPGFVAQGGDPAGNGSGGPGYTIPAEFSKSLKHLRGSLAMARTSDPNSAGSQFYVCYQPIPHLDAQYTIFGHVVSGMDVVDKLQPTDGGGKPDKMVKVTLLK